MKNLFDSFKDNPNADSYFFAMILSSIEDDIDILKLDINKSRYGNVFSNLFEANDISDLYKALNSLEESRNRIKEYIRHFNIIKTKFYEDSLIPLC